MKRLLICLLTSTILFSFNYALANDCGSAHVIVPELSLNQNPVSGTLVSETFSGVAECSGPGSNADVWYRFQANASKMFVRVQAGGDLDLALEVLDGCGGTTLQCVNDVGAGAQEIATLSGLTVGNTYYFRTYHAAASVPTTQSFTVAVSYIPTVQLKPEYCGVVDYTTNDVIMSTQPVVTNAIAYYQWQFQELEAPFDVFEVITETPTNPNIRLKWFHEIQYGRSYDVSVRLAMNPNATVGDYGPACTIKLQDDVLSTQLEEQYASGFFSFCDVIGCDDVGGADRYRWEFFDLNTVKTVYGDGDERLLRISKVPGIELGKTYIVTAYAEKNGMESPAGTLRFLNTNNFVPNTGLRNDIYPCGGTYPINSQVQAVEVCRAQSYTWRFKNTSEPQADLFYTRTGGNRFIRLEWVTGLIPGDSYDVDVKARQGNKNGDYSTICNITIGPSTSFLVTNAAVNVAFEKAGAEISSTVAHPESAIQMRVLNNGNSPESTLVMDLSSADVNQNVKIELYDLSGKMIADRSDFVQREGSIIEWQIPGLTTGIYLLRATNGDHVVTKKVSIF